MGVRSAELWGSSPCQGKVEGRDSPPPIRSLSFTSNFLFSPIATYRKGIPPQSYPAAAGRDLKSLRRRRSSGYPYQRDHQIEPIAASVLPTTSPPTRTEARCSKPASRVAHTSEHYISLPLWEAPLRHAEAYPQRRRRLPAALPRIGVSSVTEVMSGRIILIDI